MKPLRKSTSFHFHTVALWRSGAMALIFVLLSHIYCYAEETVMHADRVDYDGKTSTYRAEGSVRIQSGDVLMEAGGVIYNERASFVEAYSGVSYDNPYINIKADMAELNLAARTGSIYNAVIFVKKDNFHIKGSKVEKKAENEYFLPEASFTTCDAPVPAWCLKGRDVDLLLGNRLRAKAVTFHVKGYPVLYTPYLSAPLRTERKTGLLVPTMGYTDLTGFFVRQPFFIAFAENRDMTLTGDFYSKRGIGEALEYRYMERWGAEGAGGAEGNFFIHHINDTEENKNLLYVKAAHSQKNAFIDLNLTNFRRFFSIYEPYFELRSLRFLESNGEAAIPFENSRLYISGRNLYDLRGDDEAIPQRLPEVGFVRHPARIGPAVLSLSASAAYFTKEDGSDVQRIDLNPVVSHSTGGFFNFFQSISLRETAYLLKNGHDIYRESIRYEAAGRISLKKNYSSFRHIIEPSATYRYTARTDESPPVLDAVEGSFSGAVSASDFSRRAFPEQSPLELSVMNRLIDDEGEFMTFRLSEGFNSGGNDILRADLKMKRPVSLTADASYDVNGKTLQSLNSEAYLRVASVGFSLGERYSKVSDIMFYSLGLGYYPSKALFLEGRLWYDENIKQMRDITARAGYKSQCWAVTVLLNKRPDDLSVFITVDLLGLGTIKL